MRHVDIDWFCRCKDPDTFYENYIVYDARQNPVKEVREKICYECHKPLEKSYEVITTIKTPKE